MLKAKEGREEKKKACWDRGEEKERKQEERRSDNELTVNPPFPTKIRVLVCFGLQGSNEATNTETCADHRPMPKKKKKKKINIKKMR